MRKAITLEDIDFRAKAREDLPYLLEKATEYINKYAANSLNNGDIKERQRYLQLHFEYMEWYHGTIEKLDGELKFKTHRRK